jgi:hypothetical protein
MAFVPGLDPFSQILVKAAFMLIIFITNMVGVKAAGKFNDILGDCESEPSTSPHLCLCTKRHPSGIQSGWLVCLLAGLATLLTEIQYLFFLMAHRNPHGKILSVDFS